MMLRFRPWEIRKGGKKFGEPTIEEKEAGKTEFSEQRVGGETVVLFPKKAIRAFFTMQ